MTFRMQRLFLVPIAIGMLGLAAACSSQSSTPAAPAATRVAAMVNSAPATQAVAATVQSASTAPSAASTRAAAQPSAPAAGSAQAPVKIASALAVASAIVGGNQSSVKKIDPCQLVTRDTAEAAAKTPLELLRQYSDVTGPACEYSSDGSEVSVTISAQASGGRTEYDDLSTTYGSGRTEVAGVGDRAFAVVGLGAIFVLKGDTLVEVQLVSLKMGRDETLTALTTMAKSAVSHL